MNDTPSITCRELIDFLADYLDEALPEGQRHEFKRHLTACPSCVAYLDGYRRTIALGKMALAPTEAPAATAVPEGVVHAMRAARARTLRSGRGLAG